MGNKGKTENIVNDAIIKDIYDAVRSLEFGTVTIKVHDQKYFR